jgi:hypothetical protein
VCPLSLNSSKVKNVSEIVQSKKMKAMKNLVFILLFVFANSLCSYSARLIGKIGSNEYVVDEIENLTLGKGVEKGWTLKYNGNKNPATIVKRKTLEGTEYLVQCKFFEVCYASTEKGFGVKKVRKNWSTVPAGMTKKVINQEQFARQQIISPNKVDDEYALGLIAGFLPDLMNDGYSCFLVS